jgi:hypothetical protein
MKFSGFQEYSARFEGWEPPKSHNTPLSWLTKVYEFVLNCARFLHAEAALLRFLSNPLIVVKIDLDAADDLGATGDAWSKMNKEFMSVNLFLFTGSPKRLKRACTGITRLPVEEDSIKTAKLQMAGIKRLLLGVQLNPQRPLLKRLVSFTTDNEKAAHNAINLLAEEILALGGQLKALLYASFSHLLVA